MSLTKTNIDLEVLVASFVGIDHPNKPQGIASLGYYATNKIVSGLPIGKAWYALTNDPQPHTCRLNLICVADIFQRLQLITNGPSKPHTLSVIFHSYNWTTFCVLKHIMRVLNDIHQHMITNIEHILTFEQYVDLAKHDYKLQNLKNFDLIVKCVEEGIKAIQNINGAVCLKAQLARKGAQEARFISILQGEIQRKVWESVGVKNFRRGALKKSIEESLHNVSFLDKLTNK